MAMNPGSVTVAADASVVKSGFAGDEFDALVQETEDKLNDMGQSMPTDPIQLAPIYVGLAQAAMHGARILQYILDNAEADGSGPVT